MSSTTFVVDKRRWHNGARVSDRGFVTAERIDEIAQRARQWVLMQTRYRKFR